MINTQLSTILRQRRSAKKWTQEQLATSAGLSTRYIQSLEAGDKLPSIESVFKLANAFSTSPGQLLDPIWRDWKKSH